MLCFTWTVFVLSIGRAAPAPVYLLHRLGLPFPPEKLFLVFFFVYCHVQFCVINYLEVTLTFIYFWRDDIEISSALDVNRFSCGCLPVVLSQERRRLWMSSLRGHLYFTINSTKLTGSSLNERVCCPIKWRYGCWRRNGTCWVHMNYISADNDECWLQNTVYR